MILSRSPFYNMSCVNFSFPLSDRDIVRLLEAGAHYHIKSGLRGGGPLHQLITLCSGELLKRFRLKAAEVMLDYGVEANLTDFYGKTALMLACSEGYLELVKLLSVGFVDNNYLQAIICFEL